MLKDEDGGFYSSASDALEKVRNAVGECNLVRGAALVRQM